MPYPLIVCVLQKVLAFLSFVYYINSIDTQHMKGNEMNVTRAVVSETKAGFVVSILVRVGINCWKDSRNHKPANFQNKDLAIAYAKTFGEALYD